MQETIRVTNRKSSVNAAAWSLSKAFNRVPQALLMQKPSDYPDMEPYLLNWIHDFLWNRLQTVVLDGAKSVLLPVTSGVLQSSLLDPVLLVYIYDLPRHVDCSVGLFAEDTLKYLVVCNTTDEDRFQANLESLNTQTKTCEMTKTVWS